MPDFFTRDWWHSETVQYHHPIPWTHQEYGPNIWGPSLWHVAIRS